MEVRQTGTQPWLLHLELGDPGLATSSTQASISFFPFFWPRLVRTWFPDRDGTHAPSIGSAVFTNGPPGQTLSLSFFIHTMGITKISRSESAGDQGWCLSAQRGRHMPARLLVLNQCVCVRVTHREGFAALPRVPAAYLALCTLQLAALRGKTLHHLQSEP